MNTKYLLCKNCDLIPALYNNKKSNNIFDISCSCEKLHNFINIPISEFINNFIKENKNNNLENNFICNEHKQNYIIFCTTCRKNICKDCQDLHKNHKYIIYNDIKPKEDDLNKFKKSIDFEYDLLNSFIKEKFDKFIEDLKNKFNEMQSLINNKNILYKKTIEMYENNKINYQIILNVLNTLRHFEFQNYFINELNNLKQTTIDYENKSDQQNYIQYFTQLNNLFNNYKTYNLQTKINIQVSQNKEIKEETKEVQFNEMEFEPKFNIEESIIKKEDDYEKLDETEIKSIIGKFEEENNPPQQNVEKIEPITKEQHENINKLFQFLGGVTDNNEYNENSNIPHKTSQNLSQNNNSINKETQEKVEAKKSQEQEKDQYYIKTFLDEEKEKLGICDKKNEKNIYYIETYLDKQKEINSQNYIESNKQQQNNNNYINYQIEAPPQDNNKNIPNITSKYSAESINKIFGLNKESCNINNKPKTNKINYFQNIIELTNRVNSKSINKKMFIYCITKFPNFPTRFAIGLENGYINVYLYKEKSKSFSLELEVKSHSKAITNLIFLKNGNIASCSIDGTIKIFDLNPLKNLKNRLVQTLTGKADSIQFTSLIQMENGLIITGDWKHILIWNDIENKNQYSIINDININTRTNALLAGTKNFSENLFLSTHPSIKTVNIYNVASNKIRTLDNINTAEGSPNSVCFLNIIDPNNILEQIVVIGGLSSLYLISMKHTCLIKSFHLSELNYIKCLINTGINDYSDSFICSTFSMNLQHCLSHYKIDSSEGFNNLKLINISNITNTNNGSINGISFLEMNQNKDNLNSKDKFIITVSSDNYIKIYENK